MLNNSEAVLRSFCSMSKRYVSRVSPISEQRYVKIGVSCFVKVSMPFMCTGLFLVSASIYVFLFVVKNVFSGREITASIMHCSRIKLRSFLSLLRFITPSGTITKAFPPGFSALIIHSMNSPSIPIALTVKYSFSSWLLSISSFKLLLPLMT